MTYKPQAGDVLAVTGKDWIDKCIEWVSHSDYCHVAIFISEDKLYEAQGGRTLGECDLSFYLNNDKVTRLEVWSDPSWTDEERARVPDMVKEFEGIKYDYPVIGVEIPHFEFGLDTSWYNSHGKLDCSEFIEAFAEKFDKHWSNIPHPAPCEDIEGGVLKLMAVLKNSK